MFIVQDVIVFVHEEEESGDGSSDRVACEGDSSEGRRGEVGLDKGQEGGVEDTSSLVDAPVDGDSEGRVLK